MVQRNCRRIINHVYTYEVDVDAYENDIQNFTETLKQTLQTDAETRRINAEKARKALDKLRPEKLSKIGLIYLLKFLKTNFFL